MLLRSLQPVNFSTLIPYKASTLFLHTINKRPFVYLIHVCIRLCCIHSVLYCTDLSSSYSKQLCNNFQLNRRTYGTKMWFNELNSHFFHRFPSLASNKSTSKRVILPISPRTHSWKGPRAHKHSSHPSVTVEEEVHYQTAGATPDGRALALDEGCRLGSRRRLVNISVCLM